MKMNFTQSLFFIFVIFSFFVGLLFYTRPNTPYLKFLETMDSMESEMNSNTFSSNDLDAIMDTGGVTETNNENINSDMDLYNASENIDRSVYMGEQNASAPFEMDNSDARQMQELANDNIDINAKGDVVGLNNDEDDENDEDVKMVNKPNENSTGLLNNEIVPMNILPTPTLVSNSVIYVPTPSSSKSTLSASVKSGSGASVSRRGVIQQNKIPNANANRIVSGAVIPSTGSQPAMGPIAPQYGETVDKLRPVQNVNALQRQNPYKTSSQSSSQQDGGIYDAGFPSFKESDYTVGSYSYLDALRDATRGSSYSDNPMDSNWGGVEWSRNAVESGKYNDRLVVPHAISNGFSTSSRFNKQPLNVFA
jgi:hypothetical protein